MLIALLLLFGGALLLFYPFTIRLVYQTGVMQIYWLPRVFGGFARARELNWQKYQRAYSDNSKVNMKDKLKAITLTNRKDLFFTALRHTSLDKLDLELTVGAAGPFATSMLTGACWAALGSARGVASSALKHFPTAPQITVRPDWTTAGLAGSLECIFHWRCGDIISIIYNAILMFRKGWLKT